MFAAVGYRGFLRPVLQCVQAHSSVALRVAQYNHVYGFNDADTSWLRKTY